MLEILIPHQPQNATYTLLTAQRYSSPHSLCYRFLVFLLDLSDVFLFILFPFSKYPVYLLLFTLLLLPFVRLNFFLIILVLLFTFYFDRTMK